MSYKSTRICTCALAVALMISGSGIKAEATSRAALPGGGVELAFATESKLENIAVDTNLNIEQLLQFSDVEDAVAGQEEQEAEDFSNLVIAQVTNYVNVRSLPREDGEIVGKLYDKSVGHYISEKDGWYQIKSGSVLGYVKAEFCVTGEDAVELAKKVGTRFAKVNTTTLKVRKEADINAPVLTLVPLGDELVVRDEADGWVQVDVEEGLGWISTEFVTQYTEFVKAESKAEEEARLAKEEEERKKARAAANAKKNGSKKSSGSSATYSGGGSDMGSAVIDYAVQFVGNPYVYGGTSLTEGTDCSGFVMSVYANFGVSLPHSSASDRNQGSAVDGIANAQPGDIVCYSGHVGLYMGNGNIVHASNANTGITISRADYKDILAIRRIF